MFYSQFILAKKGPLGTIWIAAHLERKLRKNQVADTDIGVSVDSILCPEVPIALRLSSHLLLGVVRIYSRKVNYLFDDCSEALLKVKQAFRSAAVDLPPEQSKAPYHSITLPETFDLDDFELPDNEIFQGNDRHVSTREQITLQDTMDGVAFPTSQFGPDERFGDGDTSQIGLDFDEDLFMEKGDAVGTSDILNMAVDTGTDQSSVKEATSVKDDNHTERVSDLPLDSSTNYFSIQAPSTPGLMEEPNLHSVQEAMVSDDHMDEEQNIRELAVKEVSGTASSQVEQLNHEFNSNENGHHLDEQENEQLKSERSTLPNEAVEVASHGNAQPLKSIENIEAISGVDSLGDKLEYSPLQNDGIVAADSQSIEQHEVDLNRSQNVIFTEFHEPGTYTDGGKSDLNGSYLPEPDIRSENNKSVVAQEIISCEECETIVANNGCQCQKTDMPFQNLKNSETSENNGSDKSSDFNIPVLKPCYLHNHNASGMEKFPDASRLSAENDGLCSLGLSSKQDVTNGTGISTDVHDGTMPTPKADQIAHEGAYITINSDRPLDTDSLGDDQLEKESNSKVSDFSAPEKLLSMPYVPAGQPDNVLPECTPGLEVVAEHGDRIELAGDGDASFENLLSGKKRSYTESTLTIQSLNSAASSGAAQSKQAGELVPEDDDLLSSILGGRSTTFKLKPTSHVTDSSLAKRQRTTIRSSAQKRKVLMDDSMVLHGDMIREQLTNTEDIRRVRKKAPCTHLDVWILQKQFLEDEIFSEPVLTGFLPEFRCLHSHPRDLRGIKIVLDDGRKGMNETDDMARQERDSLEDIPSRNESVVVIDALQKELETFDNEVAKQMSKHDVPAKKPVTGNENQSGGEVDQPMAEAVLSSDVDGIDASRQSINQECHMDFTREEYSRMEEVSGSGRQYRGEVDVDVDGDTDGKRFLEKREVVVSADTTVGIMEDVQGTCSSPVLDIPVTDSAELEGRAPSPGIIMEECPIEEARFENEEEIITTDIRHDDSCPISIHFVEEDVKLDPTHIVETDWSSQDTKSCEKEDLQNLESEALLGTDPIDIPTEINNPADQCVDPSHIIETDLSSQDPKLNEKEDQRSLEMEPMLTTDPIAIPNEFSTPADQGDLGAEVFEHDTDFLNVDDDDVDEDYEIDMPNPEEKCMLDNSGWSSRTRAVANYLQVLFVKETHHAKKAIPLESLLVGKTRKEASRMFFETLVLKTKDYIGAEQEGSFCEIKIKSTGKLMKSEF